ncbi:MAG: hypothetical protein FWB77_03535 [Treponema sp.]|nr:hypothetical protein [Treponema sp.]
MNISSIGFKLVSIIILIVLVSLSAITALEFWLMQQDLLFSAQHKNFETNRLFAEKAREVFLQTRSDAMLIAQMISSSGANSNYTREIINFFFEQNPRTAALYFSPDELFINERFFHSRAVDSSLVNIFLNDHHNTLELADFGETTVVNAAPNFAVNLLAVFFPGKTGAQMALFSADDLNSSFGFGMHQTYMLNYSGDILIHEDYELVRSGFNAADYSFVREIMERPEIYKQSLIKTDFGIFAESKENKYSPAIGLFFNLVKEKSAFAFSKTLQFIESVYNICADAVFKLLKKERKAPRQVIITESIRVKEPSQSAPPSVSQYVAYTKLSDSECIVITSIEYDKILKVNTGISARFLFLTGAVLCFSIILIWFFVRSIFLQQKVLADVANQIEPVNANIRTRDLLVILLCIVGIIAFFSLFRLSLPKTAGLFEHKIDPVEDINIEQELPAFLAAKTEEEVNNITEAEHEEKHLPAETVMLDAALLQENFIQPALAAMPETALLSAVYVAPIIEPPLSAPENMLPYKGYRFDIEGLRNQKNLRFNWSEVPAANAYIFSLYQQTVSGRRLITRTTVEYRTGWALENLNVLSRGTFIWQVEAIIKGRGGAIDRRGNQAESAFIVE